MKADAGSMTLGGCSRWCALVALMASGIVAAGEPENSPDQKIAVWKSREVSFFYRSSIAIYGCSALKARVASILRAVGVRDDMDIHVDDCREVSPAPEPMRDPWQSSAMRFPNDQRAAPEQTTHVRIRLLLPTEVTPEILAEIDRDKSRRELISRVTGDPSARMNDPLAFPAKMQSVTLSRKSIGLEPIECELLDQMAQVLRQLDMHIVHRNFNCDRSGVSRLPPELTVETLMPVPLDVKLPEIAPAQSQDPATEPAAPSSTDPQPQRIAPSTTGG